MIKDQIKQDLTQAQKDKDTLTVGVLRMLISEMNNEEIDLRAKGEELTDAQAIKIVVKSAKKRNESIELFKKGGRDDLVETEQKELEILEKYLPEQLSQEDVEKAVDEVIQSLGDSANFGAVMKGTMAELQGQADGKIVSEVVKNKLQ